MNRHTQPGSTVTWPRKRTLPGASAARAVLGSPARLGLQAAVVMALLVGAVIVTWTMTRLAQQTETVTEPILTLCGTDSDSAHRLRESGLCDTAVAVREEPLLPPPTVTRTVKVPGPPQPPVMITQAPAPPTTLTTTTTTTATSTPAPRTVTRTRTPAPATVTATRTVSPTPTPTSARSSREPPGDGLLGPG